MTVDERFERMEVGLAETQAILRTVAESHLQTQAELQSLGKAQTRAFESFASLNESISRYVDASDDKRCQE